MHVSRSFSIFYFLFIFFQSHTPAKIPTIVQTIPPINIKFPIPPSYPIIPNPLPQSALAMAGVKTVKLSIVYVIFFIIILLFNKLLCTVFNYTSILAKLAISKNKNENSHESANLCPGPERGTVHRYPFLIYFWECACTARPVRAQQPIVFRKNTKRWVVP